jgi:hypothetical protein
VEEKAFFPYQLFNLSTSISFFAAISLPSSFDIPCSSVRYSNALRVHWRPHRFNALRPSVFSLSEPANFPFALLPVLVPFAASLFLISLDSRLPTHFSAHGGVPANVIAIVTFVASRSCIHFHSKLALCALRPSVFSLSEPANFSFALFPVLLPFAASLFLFPQTPTPD